VKSDADGEGELAEADEFFTPSPWPDPSCAVKQTAGH
jgi:hypothetical protein